MTFEQKIERLEKTSKKAYSLKEGTIPVILTAPHTMNQERLDGTKKSVSLSQKQ